MRKENIIREVILMKKCEYCQNKQVIQQGRKLIPCQYCMTEDKLMSALKRAVVDAKKEGKDIFAKKLQIVIDYLPEYPVMAAMEAEYLELNNSLILMIRDAFQTLPFGDNKYVGENSGVALDKA